MGLLIDSTVLVSAERSRQSPEELIQALVDRWGDQQLAVSVISAAELFHSRWRADSPARRARREEFVEQMLSVVPVIPVTLAVARLRRARRQGDPRRAAVAHVRPLDRGDGAVPRR